MRMVPSERSVVRSLMWTLRILTLLLSLAHTVSFEVELLGLDSSAHHFVKVFFCTCTQDISIPYILDSSRACMCSP